ncbi:substrate-binding periplasmic protein [Allorhizocola rhizosphaerae]|uniref:substrate-binding periplasmic protein n=1 Tax=Allorhizocola rhizosphaerae TaxID=1872709 RepID=UPI000E3C31BE|nr:transporter substrate-binding domain-containing protein [Allorhizocola rhizosphaerae]
MPDYNRQLAALVRPFRAWGPVLVLSAVVVVAAAVVVAGLRATPTSPARPMPVSSGSWAPFVGAELPDGGPLAKLVTETLRRSGYSPEITYTSWSLAEGQVSSGATLGVFPLVGSASRRANLLLSDRLLDFEYVLFYNRRSGEPRVESAADLSRLRVGGIAGYDYWPALESAVGDFVEFETSLDGFRALADGRVDVLAEGLLSGQAVLSGPAFAGDTGDFSHIKGDNRAGSDLVHSVEGLYFMMPNTPAGATVMERFNRELGKMRQTGEYERIVAELTPAATQGVTLTPIGETGLVELLDANGNLVLLAPQGTRAQVLAWPKEFTDSGTGAGERVLIQVKVSNGPARGRVLYVDARAVQLEDVR